ncbi:MAG: transketolase [Flavobacteriales bacterium]|nr:transketolase [Flavobacteriales bacterium]
MSNMEILSQESEIKEYIEEILKDFELACISREASLLGRKEVLTGKAKFGIFGDGKELAQIALAKQFLPGDWRSGYYRDQTILMALGHLDVKQYFAGLYAHPDPEKEPFSAGRQMGGHFSTSTVDDQGNLIDLTAQPNSSADISPTSGQMPRLLGLGLASKLFRENKELHSYTELTDKGSEVAFGTIGDASTSEGLFWETMNAAGVLQVPIVMSVWDDGYGISVSREHQTVKDSISKALAGFQRSEDSPGFEIFTVKGWDYPGLIRTYEKAVKLAREEHVPVLVHVTEVTQPQGHSTSGSHERYKSAERLQWEDDFDCIEKFKQWILDFRYQDKSIADEERLNEIRKEAKKKVRSMQKEAWAEYTGSIISEKEELLGLLASLGAESANQEEIEKLRSTLQSDPEPIRRDIHSTARQAVRMTRGESSAARQDLLAWLDEQQERSYDMYSSHLYSESEHSALNVSEVPPIYSDGEQVDGRIILRDNFKSRFEADPRLVTFGEDTGKIGGVNQSMEGMQETFGPLRVMDTGIREATIIGQGIGMAMRGLRPLAEIQYLDYLLFALQTMSDDLATLRYRTKGQQIAPLIIRTRGHRLEGIWHSGSPMGMVIHSLRGVIVCVPRNMTQAAGMFNTLHASDDAALIIEPLNAYRTKEQMMDNIGEFTIPIGSVEVVREGQDMTVLSYGSTFNLCREAAQQLSGMGIEVELVDARTLLPFDIDHQTVESLKRTNRLLVVDEDVPGGASAYLLQQVLVEQKGYYHLDSEPQTLAARPHRPAYSTDGDYFSKPSVDDIVEKVYTTMSEAEPDRFPPLR